MIELPPTRPRVALFGAGTVGTAVCRLLQAAGCEVTVVWSRSQTSVDRAIERLGAQRWDGEEVPADLVIVGGNDTAIEEIARPLTGRVASGTVVAHLSGSLDTSVLEAVTAGGARGLAMHPVQACPTVDAALKRLPGSAWGITCAPELEEWSHELIRDLLHGTPVSVPAEVRPIWHAASVMTSNGIAALLSFGERLLAEIGIDDPVSVLGPLAAGTVANARTGGGGGRTLTGPVVRGEATTVQRHLENLASRSERLSADYRAVAELILSAAVGAGRIDEDTRRRIHEVLDR